MANVKQVFVIYDSRRKVIGCYHNYDPKLRLNPNEARAQWCFDEGCRTPCASGGGCGLYAEESQ